VAGGYPCLISGLNDLRTWLRRRGAWLLSSYIILAVSDCELGQLQKKDWKGTREKSTFSISGMYVSWQGNHFLVKIDWEPGTRERGNVREKGNLFLFISFLFWSFLGGFVLTGECEGLWLGLLQGFNRSCERLDCSVLCFLSFYKLSSERGRRWGRESRKRIVLFPPLLFFHWERLSAFWARRLDWLRFSLQKCGLPVFINKANLEITGSSVYWILDEKDCHWQWLKTRGQPWVGRASASFCSFSLSVLLLREGRDKRTSALLA